MNPRSKAREPAVARPYAASLVHEKVLALFHGEPPGLLLDVPTGEGAFAVRARALGHKVSCADLDPTDFVVEGIHCAQINLNDPWTYEARTFDYVVCIEVIEHLENPWHMAREANRVLKLGGKLFLTTPNILTIRSRLSYLLYGYPNYFHYMVEHDPRTKQELPVDHINPLTFLEARHILARTGFRIERIEANRLLKQHFVPYRLLKRLMSTRGRSHARRDAAKAEIRQVLFSDTLLFGEILILKARKVVEASA